VCVFADSLHDFPVAVVIPTQQQIDAWKEKGIDDCRSQQARDDMVKKLGECASQYSLLGYEKVKRVVIDTVEFTIENELMTPSMKPHFHHVRKKFEKEIQEIYA
jgi:long-chain acyl-CoA synthetase